MPTPYSLVKAKIQIQETKQSNWKSRISCTCLRILSRWLTVKSRYPAFWRYMVDKSVDSHFLDNSWWVGAQPTMGDTIPGHSTELSKKTSLTSHEDKPVSSAPPRSLLQFLPPGSCLSSCLMECNLRVVRENKPFPPQLLWPSYFITTVETLINSMPNRPLIPESINN